MPRNSPPRRPARYAVGYGKPPKETRFTKGSSGNPSGRPRAKGAVASIEKVLGQMITMTVNGKRRRVPLTEALILQFSQRALAGSLPDAQAMFRLTERFAKARSKEMDEQLPEPHRLIIQGVYSDADEALKLLEVMEGTTVRDHRLKAWFVKAALARRVGKPLTQAEMAIVRKATVGGDPVPGVPTLIGSSSPR